VLSGSDQWVRGELVQILLQIAAEITMDWLNGELIVEAIEI
jgi:hypothetical protein